MTITTNNTHMYATTCTVPISLCTKWVGITCIHTTTRLIATRFPGHVCMCVLITERSVDLQAMWVIGVLGLLFDMLFVGVCTTSQWQASGRLVQTLNACTEHQEMQYWDIVFISIVSVCNACATRIHKFSTGVTEKMYHSCWSTNFHLINVIW